MTDNASASHFADIAQLLAEQPTLEATLREITAAAGAEVTCDYVSVSFVQRRGRIQTVAATDPVVEEADGMQYELQEGPCLGVIWERGVFVSQDLAGDPRWPTWGPKAAALGLGSLLAVRLSVGDHVEGALNLYGRHRRQFDADEVEHAEIYAAHASVALAAQREHDNLHQAIGARHLIGMAQGMLMERYRLAPDAAFLVLRRHSMELNTKLREVAAHLVQTGDLPAAAATPPGRPENDDDGPAALEPEASA